MDPQPITAIIGSLSTDQIVITHRLPDYGESLTASSFHVRCGGKGANTSVAAYRLSHKKPRSPNTETTVINGVLNEDIQVRLIGAIGNDGRGIPLINKLKQNGVDASGVRTVEGVDTGLCIGIIESDTGENRLLLIPGANRSLRPNDFCTLESLAGGFMPDLVICQLVIARDTVEKILETATAHGINTLLNPSPAQYLLRPVYRMITHLVVNETEAALLTDRPVEDLNDAAGWASVTNNFLQMGVKNVVVTLGAKGAYYSNRTGDGGYVEA
jgi:ribokinase